MNCDAARIADLVKIESKIGTGRTLIDLRAECKPVSSQGRAGSQLMVEGIDSRLIEDISGLHSELLPYTSFLFLIEFGDR